MQPTLLEEILNNSTPVERLIELASYDSTPAECLSELFRLYPSHNCILISVAQNPNTPSKILRFFRT
jgi:hypothetical protein